MGCNRRSANFLDTMDVSASPEACAMVPAAPEADTISKKPTSLLDLPVEVLQEIVAAVFALDSKCLHADAEETDGEEEDHSLCQQEPLASLQLTCKLFHQLARPHWWKDVDFEFCTNAHLQAFIDLNLAKYAIFIKTIWVRVIPDSSEKACWSPSELQELRRDEQLFSAQRRTRVCQIVEACLNLEDLDIDLGYAGRDHLRNVLSERGSTLTKLALCSNAKEGSQEADVVPLLQALPLLRTVRLSKVGWNWFSDASGAGGVCKELRQLEHLTDLDLYDCSIINDTWAELEWASNVQLLQLAVCNNLTPRGFDALVAKFKSSLTLLAIDSAPVPPDSVPQDSNFVEPGCPLYGDDVLPYDLPHLKALQLGYLDISLAYLDRFRNCKLEMITVKEVPLQVDLDEFFEFLNDHAATVKKLVLTEALPGDWRAEMSEWADTLKIEFELESEDEDASASGGMDDSDDDHFDNDLDWTTDEGPSADDFGDSDGSF